MRSRHSQLDFNYTPPPGFDTRKVKGLVATLLALKPEDHGKSTALEITAGGKLYNVVVEGRMSVQGPPRAWGHQEAGDTHPFKQGLRV